MKYLLNYSDEDYRTAINYDGTNFYNCPMTIDIDNKKYVLSTGTRDTIKVTERNYSNGTFFYIIGENTGLDYISMTVIHLLDNSVQSCYLSGNDLNDTECYSYDVLNKDTDEQIKILSEYL